MGTPPETFQPKIRKQNQFGFWNISSRLTSVASFYRKIINPIQTGGGDHARTDFGGL